MHRLSALLALILLPILLAVPGPRVNATMPQGPATYQNTTPDTSDEAASAPAQQDTPAQPFLTEIDNLEVAIPLGERQTIPITITNSDTQSHVPALYRAKQGTPSGVTPRRTLPEELRSIALPEQDERIDTQIFADLEDAPDGTAEFLVFLDEQPDLSHAYTIEDWAERGWFVYNTLYENAERNQRDLRAWLNAENISYRPLWIVNAIAVTGRTEDVQALAQRNDVALLRANYTASLGIAPPMTTTTEIEAMPLDSETILQQTDDAESIPWNISLIGADRVWHEFGISGQGIVVANNDNGASFSHPALRQQYRGYNPPDQFSHNYNWFDPHNSDPEVTTAGDHGTHTMGTIVARGNGTSEEPAFGVAPGATWITARGCQTVTCRDADLVEAAQWLLAPTNLDGEAPRPDLRPHIINNSWAGSEQSEWYLAYVTAWRAAGIFPVFVTGNSNGISCGSVVSPGDYTNVVGVGATNRNDEIASFSRVGPPRNQSIKPDLTAPGHNIRSTIANPSNPYGVLQGTSMAAPHVSGTVALLWAANPDLIGDYDATYQILIESALPITDEEFDQPQYQDCPANEVPNHIYGYGRLDTYKAMAMTQVHAPWLVLASTESLAPGASSTINVTLDTRQVTGPGTYRARVLIGTETLSQTPASVDVTLTIPNAPTHIQVNGHIQAERTNEPLDGVVVIDNGPRINVDETGDFQVTLPERDDTYTFTVSSSGYVTSSVTLPLTAGSTEDVTIDLMPDLPRAHIQTEAINASLSQDEYANRTVVVENIGTRPLTYSMEVLDEPIYVQRSDRASSSSLSNWVAAPGSSIPLTLEDDGFSERLPLGFSFPFYTKTYTSVSVYANGVLALGEALETEYFFDVPGDACFPVRETEGAALAPLRVDMNPAQGGSITYGYVPDGFLVTFENVPLHDSPDDTYTFQVLLKPDGQIVYNYLQIGSLPHYLSVGLQGSSSEVLSIGCGNTASIYNGLTIAMRPQPTPLQWIRLLQGNSGTIAAGVEAHIPVRLTWIPPNAKRDPYIGHMVLRTNDPDNETTELTVNLATTRVAQVTGDHNIWLPFIRRSQ